MIFSVDYRSEKKQQADEIKCPYNQLGLLYKFIQENPNKRVNIKAHKDSDITKLCEQIDLVKEIVGDNYTVECGAPMLLRDMLDRGYNAYLEFPICDWESFQALKELKVSDMYIDGPLGFQTDKLNMAKGNIKIRVSPQLSPNVAFTSTNNINSFFIRPEDLKRYASTIDIVDFVTHNIEQEAALFDIYKRGLYTFNLNLLMPSLNVDVDNQYVDESFVDSRLNCGQKCKIPGYSCHICEQQVYLSKQVQKYLDSEKTT